MQVDRREPVTLTLERCSYLLKSLAMLGELEGSFYDWNVGVGRRHRVPSKYANCEAAPAKEGSDGQGRTASSDANAAQQIYALVLTSKLTS